MRTSGASCCALTSPAKKRKAEDKAMQKIRELNIKSPRLWMD
jgi:hypothetical protein